MNNKKFSTLTIITCLTMLIASNLIAMDESHKRSHEDSDDNIEESQPLKHQALVFECAICKEPVDEPAPQQNTHRERGMHLGCIQGKNNHYFHTGCLNTWLTGTTTTRSQCPSCKQYLIVPPINFQAIFDAIDNNNIELLQTLIEPATINVRDEESDMTALDYAAFKGNDTIVDFLLTNGGNPNLQNKNGLTALQVATEKEHLAIVELLLTHGAKPNLQNKHGFTALHHAALRGHQPIVELLLTHHANPNLQNHIGDTALHHAAFRGHQPIVELLLTNGGNPNLQDHFGFTALHLAAAKGHLAIVEILLTNGANVSLKDDRGYNALQVAKNYGHQNIIDAINSHLLLTVYAELQKQFPGATRTPATNTLTINNITVTFSYDTDRYNPFTGDNYHTIDIMVGDNTEPLKTYLTQALGATTHKLGLLGTCWHLGTSNWQLTYRDASSWYSNYSSHSQIKPNTPLRFYLSAPDDADFKTYINFCVGLVATTGGLTHE